MSETREFFVVREGASPSERTTSEPTFRAFDSFEAAWAKRGTGQVMRIREGRAADAERACAQARWDWGWGRDAEFCTRDGVTLSKNVRMPDVASFNELFESYEPWDFNTMNHRNGALPAEGKRVQSLYGVPEVSSPFASVDMSQLGGNRFGHLAVRPNGMLRAILQQHGFEVSSFKLIAHESTGRVLVIAQHQFISGGPWLAYIDASTVPSMKEAEVQA